MNLNEIKTKTEYLLHKYIRHSKEKAIKEKETPNLPPLEVTITL
jgi:hypothetical protein